MLADNSNNKMVSQDVIWVSYLLQNWFKTKSDSKSSSTKGSGLLSCCCQAWLIDWHFIASLPAMYYAFK